MFVFFQMLIDIGVLVLCGQLLEPLWGALEFLVNQIINTCLRIENYYPWILFTWKTSNSSLLGGKICWWLGKNWLCRFSFFSTEICINLRCRNITDNISYLCNSLCCNIWHTHVVSWQLQRTLQNTIQIQCSRSMSRNDLRVVNKIVPRDKIIVVSFPSSISPKKKKEH